MNTTQHTAWISYKYRDDYTKGQMGQMLCSTYIGVCVHVCGKERVSDAPIFFNGMGCTHFFKHSQLDSNCIFVSVMAWIITSGELNTYTVKVCKENYTVRV